jgi:hypothetical protein
MADPYERTEIRDRMRITWHQPIEVDDGSNCAPTSSGRSRKTSTAR